MEHSPLGENMEKAFESKILNKIFKVIIDISTNNRLLSILNSSKTTLFGKLIQKIIDYSLIPIDYKLFDEHQGAKQAFLGERLAKKYKTVFGGYLIEFIKKYLRDWHVRQQKNTRIRPPLRKLNDIKKTYKGWNQKKAYLQPDWTIFPENKIENIKIFDKDELTPFERIDRLIKGKSVDRVAFGPQFEWAVPFFGGSNLWKHCYDGIETGWAQLNAWIRAGGMDFLPTGFGLGAYSLPYPDTHSRFFYNWTYPSDNVVPQFVEKKILRTYDDLYNYGMSGLAQEITKRMIRDVFITIREFLYLNKVKMHYFGKYYDQFYPYAEGLFAVWDILPMWRGMIPFMKDTLKRPEVVKEAFNFLNKPMTDLMIKLGKLINGKIALVGNSRGSNSYVSPQLFRELYWPSMKYTLNKLIENNIIPMCHLDNDWTENMSVFVEELPKRSCIFHLDQVDLVEIHEIVGDHFCLMGGMSPALLVYGSSEKVEMETKRYIDNIARDGLIIASGCEYPADTPAKNLYAQKTAIKKYGFF
ncbi:MAG: hypothetical protein GF364_17315 [Candidatus Lokiarchaeota archaeon]|nr:hypothetical protein [Candidatus Lokiarchaeota archaeon]